MKFIRPEQLSEQLKNFSPRQAVTKGEFTIDVPGYLEDMEWNHMDQLHRPHIHNTYESAVRVAINDTFSFSLTRWGRLPLFITVTDIRLAPGLYYQCMTIAGMFYIHFIVNMKQEDEIIKTKLEWYILSHKYLKFAHKILSRKFYKLNTRLQIEDTPIREQRYALRKLGYGFASDPVNYLSANIIKRNTIYPKIYNHIIDVNNMSVNEQITNDSGPVGFLVRCTGLEEYHVWPAVCPHEGGDLTQGIHCKNNQIQCPWHGLRFSSLVLGKYHTKAQGYGFEFTYCPGKITINTCEVSVLATG